MTAVFAARASRHSVIFTGIVILHAGVLALMAIGMKVPAPIPGLPKLIHIIDRAPPPMPRPHPEAPEPAGYELGFEPEPNLDIPMFPEPASVADTSYTGPDLQAVQASQVPMAVTQGPRVRARGSLPALVDACYPAGSRRLGEEGRVVLRVMIGTGGQAGGWTVAQSSGIPRLDDAVDCVLRRLEFVPGRRDGRAVDAEAVLPIVFQLN